MQDVKVKILNIETVTHDVKHFTLEKPAHFHYVAGQAADISINKPGWKHEKRPFTFTGLADSAFLEFIIKIYPSHHDVTNELRKLNVGDELIIHDVFGAIQYKGKGVFIAGGAGITPFIAIFRQLYKEHKLEGNLLLFSNKTHADIILKDELTSMLGGNFINILTREKMPGIHDARIDKNFLKKTIRDFDQHFYLCGPEKFTESIQSALIELGAEVDSVVMEL